MALTAKVPVFGHIERDENGIIIVPVIPPLYWRITDHRRSGDREMSADMAAYASEAHRRAGADPVRLETFHVVSPAVPPNIVLSREDAYRIVKQFDPFKEAQDA